MNLYHYTTQTGFMGILGFRELWATKIHFLNDANEYKLAFGIAEKQIGNKIASLKSHQTIERLRLERMLESLPNAHNMNICG